MTYITILVRPYHLVGAPEHGLGLQRVISDIFGFDY